MVHKKQCECGKHVVVTACRDQLVPALRDHQAFQLEPEKHRPEAARNA